MKAKDPAKARQGSSLAASHNAMRALPWAVLDALEVNRPRFFALENVPEWATDWELYGDFLRMLRRLGYKITQQVLNSEAWDVAQARERLFVIGTLGNKPIRVREPMRVKDWTPAPMANCIDWDGGEWLDIDQLERLAKAATPGPWTVRRSDGDSEILAADGYPALLGENDRDFVAAANPATVIELVERLREQERITASSLENEHFLTSLSGHRRSS